MTLVPLRFVVLMIAECRFCCSRWDNEVNLVHLSRQNPSCVVKNRVSGNQDKDSAGAAVVGCSKDHQGACLSL